MIHQMKKKTVLLLRKPLSSVCTYDDYEIDDELLSKQQGSMVQGKLKHVYPGTPHLQSIESTIDRDMHMLDNGF